jgi:predicted metal-dependent enzyme (double-stranded beta helix superfamily)
MHPALSEFVDAAKREIDRLPDVADRVDAIAPLMQRLTRQAPQFLGADHRRSDPANYRRNAIYMCPDDTLSLYALVWLPGQWTPVHDHGSWGVVGVVEGFLEERAYMCPHGEIRADSGIALKRGGVVLLNPGAVTSFVPNPDHIHMTGVAIGRPTSVSLHLYGRNMNSFHMYDVSAGTRRRVDVGHHTTTD